MQSNLVTLPEALKGVLKQYYEGAITYSEFIAWILSEIPAPCDKPIENTIYAPLYHGAILTSMLEKHQNLLEGKNNG